MGPEATADLYMRIIRETPVKKDQDHFRVIIDSNSKIPDRTPAILGTGDNPLPVMLETGKTLQKAGADFLIIPCNTAHYFHKELSAGLDVPVLHMINLSAQRASEKYPNVNKAGLLASDGTVVSGLYHNSYGEKGIEIITPRNDSQKQVMEAIYTHIKTGNLVDGERLLKKVSEELIADGAELILCGCTEVSIVLKDGDLTVPVLDPLHVLAEEAVKFASAST